MEDRFSLRKALRSLFVASLLFSFFAVLYGVFEAGFLSEDLPRPFWVFLSVLIFSLVGYFSTFLGDSKDSKDD